MSTTVDDLIDFSDPDPFSPPSSPSAGYRYLGNPGNILQPDQSPSARTSASSRPTTTENSSAVGQLISFAQRGPPASTTTAATSSSTPASTVQSPVTARTIPLPASPSTPGPASTDRTDTQSTTSTTSHQSTSTLSPVAPAFRATGRINVRSRTPPLSFFPEPGTAPSHEPSEHDTSHAAQQWSASDVGPDAMDPLYHQSGYGGGSTAPSLPSSVAQSSSTQTPAWLSPATSRPISITRPPQDVAATPAPRAVGDNNHPPAAEVPLATPDPPGSAAQPSATSVPRTDLESAPQTPTKSPTTPSSLVAASPISMTLMRDRLDTPSPDSSPASGQTNLPVHVDNDPVSQRRDDRDPVRRITESFRSISLSARNVNGEPAAHPERSHTPMSTGQRQGPDGLLTPNITGDDDDASKSQVQEAEPSLSFGQDTTLVSDIAPDALLEAANEELDDIERAWQAFRDGYSLFSGHLEESLFRLRNGDSALRGSAFTATVSAHVSASQEVRLADARALAYKSQLEKYKQRLEEAHSENGNLRDDLAKAERRAQSAIIGQRAKEKQLEQMKAELDLSEKRKTEVAGRLLRLEEEHQVLQQVSSRPDETYIVVLLEADGRMFDPELLRQGVEGGHVFITSIISRLAALYDHIRPGSGTPRILLELFIDSKSTAEELVQVGWISRSSKLLKHLDGLEEGHPLVTVHDIRGLTAIQERVKAHMEMRASTSECDMIVLGTPWSQTIGRKGNPYTGIIAEWATQPRFDKLHFIRSTATFETDPFAPLGEAKLLYLPHVFPTDVQTWKILTGVVANGSIDSDAQSVQSQSSTAISTASASTVQVTRPSVPPSSQAGPHHNDDASSMASFANNPTSRPQSVMSRATDATVSPPASISQPPWTTHMAPRPSTAAPTPSYAGGSLLDQYNASQTSRSDAASPGSDRTVGPSARHETTIAVDIARDGSPGGSPPSSDSGEPSVQLPHSARKYVRQPTKFNDADDDTRSEASTTFTDSSAGALALRRAVGGAVASVRPRTPKPIRRPPYNRGPPSRSPSSSAILSLPNLIPLGGRNDPGPSTSTQPRRSLLDRMTPGPSSSTGSSNLIDLRSQRSGTGQGMGIRGAASRNGGAGQRSTSAYHYLRSLDPLACHNLYLKGHCRLRHVGCPFGHDYRLDQKHIDMLRLLAKQVNCRRINKNCTKHESDCIYAHGCPHRGGCPYRAKCWFIDERGFHIE